MGIAKVIGQCFYYVDKAIGRCIKDYQKSLFRSIGKHVYLGDNCAFTHKNIRIGSHVYFGRNCVIQSSHGEINIGSHIMFGPGVHIHGGNHIYTGLGTYMDEIIKAPNSDENIEICDDVWIGSNAIILNGVSVGKGALIGAGAVVTKNVAPYSIVVGNPADCIKARLSPTDIVEHERLLSLRIGVNR